MIPGRKLLCRLLAAFGAVRWKIGGWRRPAIVKREVGDVPSRLAHNILYVRRGADGPAFGYLACPCGCGETLHLRFLGKRFPRWTLETDGKGRVSLRPSVWRTTGCASHFFVTAGQVRWCAPGSYRAFD